MLKQPPSTASIAQEHTNLIQTINILSESYYYLGRLDDALKVLEAGMTLLELEEVRQKDQVQLLLQYGKLLIKRRYLIEKEYSQALEYFEKAHTIASDNKMQRGIAEASSRLESIAKV